MKLPAHLRAYDLHVPHAKVGDEEAVLERRLNRRVNNSLKVINGFQYPAPNFVAIVNDGLSNRLVAIICVAARTQRVGL